MSQPKSGAPGLRGHPHAGPPLRSGEKKKVFFWPLRLTAPDGGLKLFWPTTSIQSNLKFLFN